MFITGPRNLRKKGLDKPTAKERQQHRSTFSADSKYAVNLNRQFSEHPSRSLRKTLRPYENMQI